MVQVEARGQDRQDVKRRDPPDPVRPLQASPVRARREHTALSYEAGMPRATCLPHKTAMATVASRLSALLFLSPKC